MIIPYMKWKIKFMFETTNQWCVFIFPAFPLFVLYGLGQAAWGCSLFQTNHEWVCQKKGGGAPQWFPSRAGRNHPKDPETELSHVSFIHTNPIPAKTCLTCFCSAKKNINLPVNRCTPWELRLAGRNPGAIEVCRFCVMLPSGNL